MNIKVSLPDPQEFKNPIHYLKQLELCIHHLQKSVQEIEDWNEDCYIAYRFPNLHLHDREADEEGFVKVHTDEGSEMIVEIGLFLEGID